MQVLEASCCALLFYLEFFQRIELSRLNKYAANTNIHRWMSEMETSISIKCNQNAYSKDMC